MPRLPDSLLPCVFYAYPDRQRAEAGIDLGGTGFFVTRPGDLNSKLGPVTYAVTNWHVARRGCSVIRLRTLKGNTEIVEFGPEEWECVTEGDDVAAVQIGGEAARPNEIATLPTMVFAMRENLREDAIGPGEDVFMIGRYINNDGGATNQPAVRFGNLSMMPTPVRQGNDRVRDSYIIDMHSRTGFSGSPVFAYRTFGQNLTGLDAHRTTTREWSGQLQVQYKNVFRLLGIHSGQFIEEWKTGPNEGDEVIDLPSSMTVVVPAWKIMELLDEPCFLDGRKAAYEQLVKQHPHLIA